MDKRLNRRKHLGVWLIIWPFIGLFVSLIIFALANWVFGSSVGTTSSGGIQAGAEMANSVSADESGASMFTTIVNVLLFIMGSLSIALGFPSIIIGIVLLATKPSGSHSKAVTADKKGFAIAGMVLGISSVVLSWLLGFVLGVLAIIFSSIALRRQAGKGMAVTGLVTGVVGTLIGIGFGIAMIMVAYAGVQERSTDASINVDASTVAKKAEQFWAESSSYPTYEEMSRIAAENYVVIGEQGTGSDADVIYIPCYGQGAIIWYWSNDLEEYRVLEVGTTDYCEWNE